jgi:hypothetical protein
MAPQEFSGGRSAEIVVFQSLPRETLENQHQVKWSDSAAKGFLISNKAPQGQIGADQHPRLAPKSCIWTRRSKESPSMPSESIHRTRSFVADQEKQKKLGQQARINLRATQKIAPGVALSSIQSSCRSGFLWSAQAETIFSRCT